VALKNVTFNEPFFIGPGHGSAGHGVPSR
jgi:hypothetical protein